MAAVIRATCNNDGGRSVTESPSSPERVEYASKADSQQILSFYMGKNTPERKDYIMENLVVPVEE